MKKIKKKPFFDQITSMLYNLTHENVRTKIHDRYAKNARNVIHSPTRSKVK